MSELILHHYPQSPFAEKARMLLGFKGLSWRSVMIPAIMPKPDLTALTGGYRRTPVLQVGADIYCDTAVIARRLEREQPAPPLFPHGLEATAASLAQFADQILFQHAVAINFQPKGVAERFKNMPEEVRKAFVADRQALFANGSGSRLPTEVALSQWPTLLGRLEKQLNASGPFLLGREPCIADLSHYHPLWFVAGNAAVAEALDPYPEVAAWLDRVGGLGHGQSEPLDAIDAIRVAHSSAPEELNPGDFVDPNGFEPGQCLGISAFDYGADQVKGTLVYQDAEEIVIRREDERAGVVQVHFPRYGFRVEKL